MTVENDIKQLKNHIHDIDLTLAKIQVDMAVMKGSQETTTQLLKYVVTPLILILGALVGVKLVTP